VGIRRARRPRMRRAVSAACPGPRWTCHEPNGRSGTVARPAPVPPPSDSRACAHSLAVAGTGAPLAPAATRARLPRSCGRTLQCCGGHGGGHSSTGVLHRRAIHSSTAFGDCTFINRMTGADASRPLIRAAVPPPCVTPPLASGALETDAAGGAGAAACAGAAAAAAGAAPRGAAAPMCSATAAVSAAASAPSTRATAAPSCARSARQRCRFAAWCCS
jgi:hypothetical protein